MYVCMISMTYSPAHCLLYFPIFSPPLLPRILTPPPPHTPTPRPLRNCGLPPFYFIVIVTWQVFIVNIEKKSCTADLDFDPGL